MIHADRADCAESRALRNYADCLSPVFSHESQGWMGQGRRRRVRMTPRLTLPIAWKPAGPWPVLRANFGATTLRIFLGERLKCRAEQRGNVHQGSAIGCIGDGI